MILKESAMLARKVRLHDAVTASGQRGAAMAEYGLLLALVALVAVAILATFGDTRSDTFGFAAQTFDEANTTTPTP